MYEWSRENFPELPLNVRWSKDRLVRTVEAYLDTPQVVLGIRALRVPHYPPETCVAEHCSVNFNFDLIETAGWFNMHAIPQGFGWSDVDPGDGDERGDREARDFVFQTDGTEYVGKKAGAPYDPFAGVTREQLSTGGSAGVPTPDPRASARTRGDGGEPTFIWERGDGASVPNRGNPDLATVLQSVADAGGDPTSTRAVLAAIADPFKPGYDWQKPGAQGAYPPGRYPGGGGFAGTWSNSENHPGSNDGGWRSARRGDEPAAAAALPAVRARDAARESGRAAAAAALLAVPLQPLAGQRGLAVAGDVIRPVPSSSTKTCKCDRPGAPRCLRCALGVSQSSPRVNSARGRPRRGLCFPVSATPRGLGQRPPAARCCAY